MGGVVVRNLVVHNEAAGHEANRDQDASDGKESDVAMHRASDHQKPVSATRCTAKSSAIARGKREPRAPWRKSRSFACEPGTRVPDLNNSPTLH